MRRLLMHQLDRKRLQFRIFRRKQNTRNSDLMELLNSEASLFLVKIVVHNGDGLVQHLHRALEDLQDVSHPFYHLLPVLALDLMLLESL